MKVTASSFKQLFLSEFLRQVKGGVGSKVFPEPLFLNNPLKSNIPKGRFWGWQNFDPPQRSSAYWKLLELQEEVGGRGYDLGRMEDLEKGRRKGAQVGLRGWRPGIWKEFSQEPMGISAKPQVE